MKDFFRIIWAELGYRIRGISVMIDLTNACSFSCPSCPVGFEAPRSKGKMTFETFKAMLDKIQAQTKIKYVLLYVWSEPFLSPILPQAVAELKRRKIRSMVSTNLSRTANLEAVLAAGLDELRISFSGFENGEYFHTGRNMQQFISACNYLARLLPKYKTKVSLIFHHYKTNEHEISHAKRFAWERGFWFIDEPAFFIGWRQIVEKDYTPDDLELIAHLKATPEQATKDLPYQDYCYYQRQQIAVDANGDVMLCRHLHANEYNVGNVLEKPVDEIRQAMIAHDFCIKCKNHKLNTFAP